MGKELITEELTIEEFISLRINWIKTKKERIENNGHSKGKLLGIMKADDVENKEYIISENIDEVGTESLKKMIEERNKTVVICVVTNYICPICGKNKISVNLTKSINMPVCSKACVIEFNQKNGRLDSMERLDKIIKEQKIKYVPLVYVYK